MASFTEGNPSFTEYNIKLNQDCFIDNFFIVDFNWLLTEPIPPVLLEINNQSLPTTINNSDVSIKIIYNGDLINQKFIENWIQFSFQKDNYFYQTKEVNISIKKEEISFNIISDFFYTICNQTELIISIQRFQCTSLINLEIVNYDDTQINITNWTTSSLNELFKIEFQEVNLSNTIINLKLNGCNEEITFDIQLSKVISNNLLPKLITNIPISLNPFIIEFETNNWSIENIIYDNSTFNLSLNNNIINGYLLDDLVQSENILTIWKNNCNNELFEINIPFNYGCIRNIIICDDLIKSNLIGNKIITYSLNIPNENLLCCDNENYIINYEINNDNNINIWTPLLGSFENKLNIILEISNNQIELPITLKTCSDKLIKKITLSFINDKVQLCHNPQINNINTQNNTLIINLEPLEVNKYLFTYAPISNGYPIIKKEFENSEENTNSIVIENIQENNYIGTLQSLCNNSYSDIIKFNFNIINNQICNGIININIINITNTSIIFDINSNDSQWEIIWGIENDEFVYHLISNTNNIILNNLTSNTNYIINVRSLCGTDFSETYQFNAITLSTPCDVVNDLSYFKNGDILYLNWNSNGNKWKVQWFSNNNPTKEVYLQVKNIGITDLELDVLWFFRVYTICDDNISNYQEITWFENSIQCDSPNSILISNITQSQVMINWSGDVYLYEIKLDNGNNIITYQSNTNSIFINNLIQNTNYYGEIKSFCNINSKSLAISFNFKTL